MTKIPVCVFILCMSCSVCFGQTWSPLPVDLIVPMNTSTPGTPLTESILSAGTVYGASCDAGANCTWGQPASGAFTVGANPGFTNLGPVAVDGGTTYPANTLNYNNVAYNTNIPGPGTTVTLDISGAPGTATSVSGLVGLTTPPIEPESGSNIDMLIFYSSNGDYAVTQFNPHCTGSTYGVWIEVKPTARSSCISVLPQTNYYFAMYYNFTSGLATLYVYNPNGTLVGSTSITSGDTGGTFALVRFGNDETGFAPGTSYFQNLMLNWTTAPNPMFWTPGSVLSFGPVPVGTPAPTQTLTYNFTSQTTLTSVDVLTAGAAGLDYTNAGTGTCAAGVYNAGQSCTVAVEFNPTAPGARAGAVTLFAQGSNSPLMTWYLSGIGQSGAVTIDPGTQSTIPLAGAAAGYGSTVDGAGNIYVVDHANGQVIKLAAGSLTQSTVLTGLSNPTAVAVDGAGNLYISDTGNKRVVKVPNENGTLNGNDMSVVSIPGLSSAGWVATDDSGNLYVSDPTNGDVVSLPPGGGTVGTVASGLTNPSGVAVDAGGNVYVAANNAVTEYPFGGGTPVQMGSGYNDPSGLAVSAAGTVYVADTGNGRIVEVTAGGASQSSLPIVQGVDPQGVSLDSAGDIYFTGGNGEIFEVNRRQAAGLVFPTTNAGTTSAAQTVTITNAGNQPLIMSNLALTGNFTQTASGGTDCSSTSNVSSGGQCLIAVAFAPTGAGTLTGTVTLTDNSLNASSTTQTIALSGTGGQAQAATPTFSPAAGTYTSAQAVTISDATPGAAIYYTTNGAMPTTSSTPYTAPITVSSTETIMAVAAATGYANSAVGSAAYTINLTAATPTFSPAAGTYTSAQMVTISDTTPGAAIYYTTNGATPTTSSTPYTAPITVSATETIMAIAVATGYTNSAVGSAAYTINLPTAATPTFSPAPGTYASAQTVTISDTTPGAAIYYTTNGTIPTTSSTRYTAPVTVSATETIKAIAVATGYTNSAVGSAAYTINLPTAAAPTFSPAPGTYTSAQTVTISDTTTGAAIYYTTNGATPTTGSTPYTAPITVSSTETIMAIAVATGYTNSAVGSAAYTINLPTAATPTFSPVAGTYTSAQTVTISDTTPRSAVYYTTNGATPTTSSTLYTAPITVSSTETIKAIAVATGYTNSAVGSAAYTINLPTAATPTFSPAPGTYASAQTVTISDTTPGAAVYYTTNGATPTTSSTPYTAPITVSSTETIKAIAVASGYTNSAVGSAAYTINLTAATPTFSPAPGKYTSAQTVTISDTTTGAAIYYTTNGATPSTRSTLYTAPITVSSSKTIKAIAIAPGYANSAVGSAKYTIR